MKVVFRADASQHIGTGHIMRSLTLADALNARGAECRFICREHPGNLIEFIRSKGYPVHGLPFSEPQGSNFRVVNEAGSGTRLPHSAWLGATLEQDVAACAVILGELETDWLVVDHYALDSRWEVALKRNYHKLMVIDDLADRPHQSNVLLDQTLGRNPADYAPWLSAKCTLLCGSQYALLRPEFAKLRAYSLARRENAQLRHLLISMGGVDKDNVTGQVLHTLQSSGLPADCRITVVMGATAPWLTQVRQQAQQMSWPVDVRVNVNDMAQLMADSDLAIGAAGSTSWERCCLGLPTVLVVLADNQRQVARALEQVGAAYVLQDPQVIKEHLPQALASLIPSPSSRSAMSQAAQRISDGNGVAAVIQHLES
ncbi:UDP-2,4-diacetamido-2,4,6-trideoxy-beta-L-altropyranose hydrolase [Pseudomonas sp. NFACC09-4]|uniref:UDP-2,4-diacetamido-2,4, 6-trideoxy-beta-L-altropyranose hydrolase n=1 Tax=Pseudomonas TaxID=286 RepID=UPI00090880BE|nr:MULTISPECIES: UDP-2,4-diacetamido-2,4,6-trideoxy-beta-L-altropyranose hydrolase [Pseudomonas]MDT8904335.1 UDP-2,4-diacetamido-2,4,6-trideoxy-beta-L-altropyranose hydrolase [Pseudomonas prosekii]NHN69293.1 UDP-2,4-diacetamido-2,4,6-trideoxy-beta-L-altropyranose hydrolase [Pseudomonas fluorescens]ROO33828.1 UDP-2,4-diacetamido-2,4,6-trideoxy-beta-L-altropyranose hydrolase [Pseudomonas sp. AF76]SFW29494.1 UDP-2,4-diacetamido-2,4,6-trideoxy-beta-L-altropyranose hydrolase [Pseudomonas sp. NFACC09